MRWYTRHEPLITLVSVVGTFCGLLTLLVRFPNRWVFLVSSTYALLFLASVRRWRQGASAQP